MALHLVESRKLIFKLIDLTQTAATVRVSKRFRLGFINAKLYPKGFDSGLEIAQFLLTVLFFLRETVPLGLQALDIFGMQTKLFWGFTIILDNRAVLLRLRSAKLSPQLNNII